MPDTNPSQSITPTSAGRTGASGASLLQLARAPAARQFVLLIGIAMAVALGVAIVLWSRGPNMGLLYTGLAPKDASGIVQALQAANTPYTLGSNGTSIFVPAADIDATRLRLAAQGLPEGTASSEIMPASNSAFGLSDAAQAERSRQLLEQDLERTIASLQSIRSARVQLALPKPSAFIRDNHQPSASVLVSLYPGRTLAASQVAAIVHLVAASVPNLDPSRVSVVDQQGQLLTDGKDGAGADAGSERMRLTARIENVYAQRVENILAPITGAGHVRAQVHVDLDLKHTQQASEIYGKDKEALRSEQVSSETRSANAAAGAVPGALSNQPPVTVPQPTAARPGVAGSSAGAATAVAKTGATATPTQTSHHATRNYEVDHTISYTTDPAGDISRLTVAVIVDNRQVPGKDGKTKSVPYTKAELAHMAELTRSAVGFSARRGDVVSVVNEPFLHVAAPGAAPAPPFWQRPGVMDMLKQGLGILAALALALGLLRPMLRGLLRTEKPASEPQPPLPGPQPIAVAAGTGGNPPPQVEHAKRPAEPRTQATSDYDQKVGLARRTATESPRQVAQIVKSWVAADGN